MFLFISLLSVVLVAAVYGATKGKPHGHQGALESYDGKLQFKHCGFKNYSCHDNLLE